MQCTGNWGCFPRGKWAAIVGRYPIFYLLCAVFSCFHSIGCDMNIWQIDIISYMESLTCVHIWVCAVRMKGGHTQTSLHKGWLGLGGTETPFLTLPHQGIEPRVFGFELRVSEALRYAPCLLKSVSQWTFQYNLKSVSQWTFQYNLKSVTVSVNEHFNTTCFAWVFWQRNCSIYHFHQTL